MNARQTALGRAAVGYARRGIAVSPLAEGTKIPPRGSHGYLDASTDPELAASRWAEVPHNISAATGTLSGFWVFDVDRQHGGLASLANLEADYGPLPATVEAATPSGGRHLYFLWQPDGPIEIRNSCSRIGPGQDVRGEGGSIALPPSRLRDGRCYRWVRNGATTFAAAPGWLVELAAPPPPPPRANPKPLPDNIERYVASAVAQELRRLDGAANGTRNATLNTCAFALAGFVHANALPEDWARSQLESRAVALGLPAIEARRTIASAFAAAQPRELPS